MQGFFKIITITCTIIFSKKRPLVYVFLWLLVMMSCQTAYYIPAYKQLPSYNQKGDINAAILIQQGYTSKGYGGFINGAITQHVYAGYQYNKNFDSNIKSTTFESNYHEVIGGVYKSGQPQSMMTLDTGFMKAATIYGFHLGFAYQDWLSNADKPSIFYAKKKMTFNKYFMQFSIGSKTKVYEGNFVLYGAWFDLQTLNYTTTNTTFSPSVIPFSTNNAYKAAMEEKAELQKAKGNFIYGISYSGSILINDFRIVFNLNSPNSLGSILRQPYLDFESINLFAGLQYQLSTNRTKRKINRYGINK
jgi:hypothetical protein